jgi:RNA recognition motif-containing protein
VHINRGGNSNFANVEFKTVEAATSALEKMRAAKFHGQPIYADFDRKANDPSPYQVKKRQDAYGSDGEGDEGKENDSSNKKKAPTPKVKTPIANGKPAKKSAAPVAAAESDEEQEDEGDSDEDEAGSEEDEESSDEPIPTKSAMKMATKNSKDAKPSKKSAAAPVAAEESDDEEEEDEESDEQESDEDDESSPPQLVAPTKKGKRPTAAEMFQDKDAGGDSSEDEEEEDEGESDDGSGEEMDESELKEAIKEMMAKKGGLKMDTADSMAVLVEGLGKKQTAEQVKKMAKGVVSVDKEDGETEAVLIFEDPKLAAAAVTSIGAKKGLTANLLPNDESEENSDEDDMTDEEVDEDEEESGEEAEEPAAPAVVVTAPVVNGTPKVAASSSVTVHVRGLDKKQTGEQCNKLVPNIASVAKKSGKTFGVFTFTDSKSAQAGINKLNKMKSPAGTQLSAEFDKKEKLTPPAAPANTPKTPANPAKPTAKSAALSTPHPSMGVLKRQSDKLDESDAKPSKLSKSTLDATVATEEAKRRAQRESRTLFIGGLTAGATNEDVKALHPTIQTVRRNVKSHFAHVTFADEKAAEAAFPLLSKKKFSGQQLTVDYTGDKAKNKKATVWGDNTRDVNPLVLYIGNLPVHTSTENLQKMFPQSATSRIASNRSKKTGCYAFVTFATQQEARAAFNAAGSLKMKGSIVDVVYAKVNKKDDKADAGKTKAAAKVKSPVADKKQKGKKQTPAQVAAAELSGESNDEEMYSDEESDFDNNDGMLDAEAVEAGSDESGEESDAEEDSDE